MNTDDNQSPFAWEEDEPDFHDTPETRWYRLFDKREVQYLSDECNQRSAMPGWGSGDLFTDLEFAFMNSHAYAVIMADTPEPTTEATQFQHQMDHYYAMSFIGKMATEWR